MRFAVAGTRAAFNARGFCRGNDAHFQRLHHQLFFARDKTEAHRVQPLKLAHHFIKVSVRDRQRGVGAAVAKMQQASRRKLRRVSALRAQFFGAVARQRVQTRAQCIQNAGIKRRLHRLLPLHHAVGQAHSIRRQHAGERVHQNALHAQRVGDQARVLPAGAAEAAQCVFGYIVAALHRDFFYRVRHVFHGDFQKAGGDRFRRARVPAFFFNARREFGERALHRAAVQRHVGAAAENLREQIRLQFSEHDIAVGDGERSAAAVANRARVRAGRVGTDAVTRAVKMQQRAAAGGHGVNQKHRRAQPHAGDFGFKHALKIRAVVMADIGGGAAHVKADDSVKAGRLRHARHADHAAGRPRQHRVLALKKIGVGQPAAGAHELQPAALLL